MARTRLQKCTACGEYGLGEECKDCGGRMITVAPLKFSPQDAQGARRRQRENAGSDEWIEKLPTPRKGDEEE
jgi:rRNA maturation protein Nop10